MFIKGTITEKSNLIHYNKSSQNAIFTLFTLIQQKFQACKFNERGVCLLVLNLPAKESYLNISITEEVIKTLNSIVLLTSTQSLQKHLFFSF